MKTTAVRLLLTCLLICGWQDSSQAQEPAKQPLPLVITATKKRLEIERDTSTSVKTTKEEWAFAVSVRNGSFAEVSDLTVQYRLYMKDDSLENASKTNLPLRKQEGSTAIAVLPAGKPYEFMTSKMKIETSDLKGGYYYTNAPKEKTKDSLYGIWIRILKDNAVVAEYLNPPILKTKVKWE